jgi:hypothetical protein
MAQGFAFGTGSAMARRAVDSVMGGGGEAQEQPQQQQQQMPQQQYIQNSSANGCEVDANAFSQCIQQNAGNVSACDFFYQALQSCQQKM